MEERGNQTVMCSVFFLDIVEYSKKLVTGQISLKDRFNSYLSVAIRDVPITDRIILDTGDGAAINFLGDVEDAFKAALSLRESLLNEGPDIEHPLLVRMGINLGPVRLVRDINGQPNIVGDGINVAQRVMSFADASQILVSRSYYDAVSRLSPQYAGMFHYQGSRTDKHVREHEVYAIGYPGDKITQQGTDKPVAADESPSTGVMGRAKVVWYSAATKLDVLIEHLADSFRQAGTQQRAVYVGAVAIPLLLLIAVSAKLVHRDEVQITSDRIDKQSISSPPTASAVADVTAVPVIPVTPISAVSAVAPVQTSAGDKAKDSNNPQALAVTKQEAFESKVAKPKHKPKPKHPKVQPKTKNHDKGTKRAAVAASSGNSKGYISVSCKVGTEVFLDGVRKGKISSLPLIIVSSPGKHTVIVSHPRAGVFSQEVAIEAGKTVYLAPSFCNR